MNSKKLLVAFLFILTVLVGGFAIYLTWTLNNRNTDFLIPPSPTPFISITPTDNVMPTVKVTVTSTVSATPTPDLAPADCGAGCSNLSCVTGSSCVNINGLRRCVLTACMTTVEPPVLNSACNSDLCTIKNNIEVTKVATLRCQGTTKTRLMTVSIKVSNSPQYTSTRNNIKVVDFLGNPSLIQYYNPTSGNGDAKANTTDNTIVWENVSLGPQGASQEFHYTLSLPNSENGKTYSSTVNVYENGQIKGSFNYNVTVDVLPCTALSFNDSLLVITGAIFLLLGMFAFRLGWNTRIGNYFWNHGLAGFSKSSTRIISAASENYELAKLSKEERYEAIILRKQNKKRIENHE